jgi:hypothetical protein
MSYQVLQFNDCLNQCSATIQVIACGKDGASGFQTVEIQVALVNLRP